MVLIRKQQISANMAAADVHTAMESRVVVGLQLLIDELERDPKSPLVKHAEVLKRVVRVLAETKYGPGHPTKQEILTVREIMAELAEDPDKYDTDSTFLGPALRLVPVGYVTVKDATSVFGVMKSVTQAALRIHVNAHTALTAGTLSLFVHCAFNGIPCCMWPRMMLATLTPLVSATVQDVAYPMQLRSEVGTFRETWERYNKTRFTSNSMPQWSVNWSEPRIRNEWFDTVVGPERSLRAVDTLLAAYDAVMHEVDRYESTRNSPTLQSALADVPMEDEAVERGLAGLMLSALYGTSVVPEQVASTVVANHASWLHIVRQGTIAIPEPYNHHNLMPLGHYVILTNPGVAATDTCLTITAQGGTKLATSAMFTPTRAYDQLMSIHSIGSWSCISPVNYPELFLTMSDRVGTGVFATFEPFSIDCLLSLGDLTTGYITSAMWVHGEHARLVFENPISTGVIEHECASQVTYYHLSGTRIDTEPMGVVVNIENGDVLTAADTGANWIMEEPVGTKDRTVQTYGMCAGLFDQQCFEEAEIESPAEPGTMIQVLRGNDNRFVSLKLSTSSAGWHDGTRALICAMVNDAKDATPFKLAGSRLQFQCGHNTWYDLYSQNCTLVGVDSDQVPDGDESRWMFCKVNK